MRGNLWIKPKSQRLTSLLHTNTLRRMQLFSFFSSPNPPPRLLLHCTCRNTPALAGRFGGVKLFKWANTMCFFFFPDLINAPIKRKENWLPKGDFAEAALIKSWKHEWYASWSDVTAGSLVCTEKKVEASHASTSPTFGHMSAGRDWGGTFAGTLNAFWDRCIVFGIFLPLIGKKKKCISVLFPSPSCAMFCKTLDFRSALVTVG